MSKAESLPSSEVAATTTLPNPSNLTITDVGSDYFDLSWTDNSDNENQFEIYYKLASASTWSEESTAANNTTYTLSGLQEGTEYEVKVAATTEHTESDSNIVSAHTIDYLSPTVSTASTTPLTADSVLTSESSGTFPSATTQPLDAGYNTSNIVTGSGASFGLASVAGFAGEGSPTIFIDRSVLESYGAELVRTPAKASLVPDLNQATLVFNKMKLGDTQPPLRARLQGIDADRFYNADINVKVRDTTNGTVVVNSAIDDRDVAEREVVYSWDGTEISNAGTHQVEFELTYADSSNEHYPDEGYLEFEVEKSLDML